MTTSNKALASAACAVLLIGLGCSYAAAVTSITACGSFGTGSYLVANNITSAGVNCLVITASQVTIDLNGFTLTGSGGTNGVLASGRSNVTVRNGTFNGFARAIFATGTGAVIDGVRAVTGSANGFTVGDSGTVENSYVTAHNGGIVAGKNARLLNNTLTGNTGTGQGASLGDNSRVSDSLFINNSGSGLSVGKNSVITNCTFTNNVGMGLVANLNAVVSGSTANNNTSHGIQTAGNATLTDNTSSGNGGDGFVDSGVSTYRGNSAAGNNGSGFDVNEATLAGNSSSGNSGRGFVDSGFSTYQNNTADSNQGDNFHSAGLSTFTGNTASNSVTAGGFVVICPTNLIGNTAKQNFGGNFVPGGAGCISVNNLF